MRYFYIRTEQDYEEYPITGQTNVKGITFALSGGDVFGGGKQLLPYQWTEVEFLTVLYLPEEYETYQREAVTFLSHEDADVLIPGCRAKMFLEGNSLRILNSKDSYIYLNQERVGDGTYEVGAGDILFIDSCKIVIGERELKIWSGEGACSLVPMRDRNLHHEGYPTYKRSPRLIHRTPDEAVKIAAEPKASKMGGKSLLQTIIPPLSMLAVTITVGVLMRRGIMIMMSATATGMTAIFSVVKFFQDRKELKETNRKQRELYGKYLIKKQKEAYEQWNREKTAYRYNYPGVEEIEEMIEETSSRIYERTNMDDDFLCISLGHYDSGTSFAIEDKLDELSIETGKFTEDVKEIKRRYGRVDKPWTVDLKRTHLGLVGEKKVIHEQLKYYILQMAFAQSYHDLQFVVLYDQKYERDFHWMRWLTHSRLSSMNVLGLISTDKSRDQILSGLQQILKERRLKVEESKKESRFLPHIVFVIDEPKMVIDHSIMEYLTGNQGMSMGYSILYSTDQQANLPENIDTVLLLEHSDSARLLLHEKELCDRKLALYRMGNHNFEMMARNLGVLQHELGATSHIPESITFLEMYDVQNPSELQIARRWSRNNSSKTLSVPLGVRGDKEVLELNLHEKAHGPHGLVAGTTGSGKSEIVQSYILSLAVNFHPYEVGFLLIDYKGGGMANLFKDLPHLLGTITNLDGSESMRALASIQAELRRRQAIFLEHDVNHINAYNDLFKEGKVNEPIPHLFLISDEFAELKKEQPEFMKELVSTARIGRSLGVHLILATQKPTGVVDDQIWTNSKFKLCLKVQNEADSKEVLHTPDASNITQAGRAYLQVGNNEIYELFQSAWSGARYIEETEKEVTRDNRVYLVNALGQGELINQDLRGSKAEQESKETQLDVVIQHIREIYDKEAHKEVKKPWLPSLSHRIINPQEVTPGKAQVDLRVALGVRDIPEEQLQEEYAIDLARQGNILYIASSGYGKSVFLSNAVLNLAAKNRVSTLNFYVLDFGNNALITLKRLPHMAEYIMLDEEEKYQKFLKLLQDEMKVRKKKLAQAMAQNFYVYNETSREKLRAIVVAIDNYDAIKEMGYEMEQIFTRMTRDGAGLGIYFMATASQMSAVRTATMNNFKNKIAGFNYDEVEIKSLVGRSEYKLPDIQGRAMIKGEDTVNVMQLYTPVAFADELEYGRNLQAKVESIAKLYPNEEAPHIPILPDEYSVVDFQQYQRDHSTILLGLDHETVVLRGIGRSQNPFLIFGESGSGKTNALKVILSQIHNQGKVFLVDSSTRGLYSYKDRVEYITTYDELCDLANFLSRENRTRQAQIESLLKEGLTPDQAMDKLDPVYVLIDDIDDMIALAGNDMMVIGSRMKAAIATGIQFIVTAHVNKFKGSDELTQALKATKNGLLLSGQGYLTIFPIKVGTTLEKPDALFMRNGSDIRLRMPLAEG